MTPNFKWAIKLRSYIERPKKSVIISRVAIPINLLRPFITFYFLYEICYIFPEYLARKNLRRTNNIILIRKNLPLRWNLTLHCWTLPKHESEPCVIDESL